MTNFKYEFYFYKSTKIFSLFNFLSVKFFLKKSRYINFKHSKVQFSGLKYITLGTRNVFFKYVNLNVPFSNKNQSIEIGNRNIFESGATINAHGGYIKIGDNNFIGQRVQIQGYGGVEIGNDCMIAANTFISSSNHIIDNPVSDDYLKKEIGKKVLIEDKVWIGANCVITAGVHIKAYSIVAAGSVVTRDVDSYCIVAGVPAKIIKKFDLVKKEWIRIRT